MKPEVADRWGIKTTPVVDPAMRAAVYRRVSTDQQTGSLETQDANVLNYVKFKRFEIDETTSFHDEDTSGSIPLGERAGGARLLNTLELGAAKHLVVAKLDRLARNVHDLLSTVKRLDELGVTLHIVDMGGDSLTTSGPVGRLMLSILGAVAEFEREAIRSRIRDRLGHKHREGHIIGTIPYGFQPEPGATQVFIEAEGRQKWVTPDGRPPRLVVHPEEKRWLLHMQSRRKEGWSYQAIARELNECKIPTKTGKLGAWQQGNVQRALTNKHSAKILEE